MKADSAYFNLTQIWSWNQPILSNEDEFYGHEKNGSLWWGSTSSLTEVSTDCKFDTLSHVFFTCDNIPNNIPDLKTVKCGLVLHIGGCTDSIHGFISMADTLFLPSHLQILFPRVIVYILDRAWVISLTKIDILSKFMLCPYRAVVSVLEFCGETWIIVWSSVVN